MAIDRILDLADPRVAAYRGVSDAQLLMSHGLFVAEGRLVVRRLIEDGRYALRSVLASEAAARSLAPCLASLEDRVPVYLCETSAFECLTGHHIHRGCLALVERPPTLAPDAILADARTVVVLERVTNADNVGGVFRNAAAFGADAVLLSPTSCDPLYRKAIRTSMGATLRVPWARVDDWPDGLSQFRARGFTLVALAPREPSVTIDAFAASSRPSRVALLVGTEGEGLTAAAEAAADLRVRIPMTPAVDSLNLAVAVGIALHRLA